MRVARDALSCYSHHDCIKSCRVLQACHSALGPYHLWSALIAGLWPGLGTSKWFGPHWMYMTFQLARAGISLTLFRVRIADMYRTSRHTTHAQPTQAPPSFAHGPSRSQVREALRQSAPRPMLLAAIGCSLSLHHQGCRSTRREGCHSSPRRDWSGKSQLRSLQYFCHEAFIGQTGDTCVATPGLCQGSEAHVCPRATQS